MRSPLEQHAVLTGEFCLRELANPGLMLRSTRCEHVVTSVIGGGGCSSDRGNAGREKANSADLEQPHKLNQPKPPKAEDPTL